MLLDRIRISTQVYAGYAAMVIALAVLAVLSVVVLRSLDTSFKEAARITAQVIEIGDINEHFQASRTAAARFQSSVAETDRQAAEEQFSQAMVQFAELSKTLLSPERQKLAQTLQAHLATYTEGQQAGYEARLRMHELDLALAGLGGDFQKALLALRARAEFSVPETIEAAQTVLVAGLEARREVARGTGVWNAALVAAAQEYTQGFVTKLDALRKTPGAAALQQEITALEHPAGRYVAYVDELGQVAKVLAANATKLSTTRGSIDQTMRTLQEGLVTEQQDLVALVADEIASNLMMVLIISAAFVALGVVAAFVIGRNISRPLNRVSQVIDEISRTKDLVRRVDYDAQNEIGQIARGFNGLMQVLHDAFQGISQNTRQVAAAAGQASSAVGQVSDGSQNQLNAISQISAAMEQTSKAINDVAGNSSAATGHAKTAAQMVAHGKEKMTMMVEVANLISDNSKKINQITEVISRIANQTNMLSLNAAIEAARAGEHGKGFAVVAEEVRKLAEHAASSVEQITALVEHADREAQRSLTMVNEVNGDMNSIADSVRQSDSMIQSIAAAITQQSSSVEEINSNIRSLNKIGETNAAASEEIAATMMELARLADQTRVEMEQFRM